MLAMWLLTHSLAAMVCTWLLAGGVLLWLMAALLFYCRQLAVQEEAELEEMASRGDTGTIFEGEGDMGLRPAATRLAAMERWVVPIFTLLWAAGHAVVAALTLGYLVSLDKPLPLAHAGPAALFAVLIAFMSFLFSRYCTGLGTQKQWRLLRATGSYLLVNVLLIVGVLAGLLAATQEYAVIDLLVAYVGPVVQLILAVELTLNVILDFYRPRVPGQEQRPPLDSRLFNLVAQPERVGHTIAETLNYQFGFEVSKTWFYQLLSRAFVPLIILGAAVMFLMSAIVIVPEGHEAIMFHFGKPLEETMKPGIGLKWPWPVDRAEMFDKGRVYEIVLGQGEQRQGDDATVVNGRRLSLWTQEHGDHEEENFLVAVPPRGAGAAETTSEGKNDQAPPSVDIIKLVVPVHYRIIAPLKYGYHSRDSHALLTHVASREMVQYCASATLTSSIEQGDGPRRPEAIMTHGRQAAAGDLKRLIQKAADELDLGVEVTYVGLLAVHPPSEVAPEYEKVLEAERAQDEKRYKAQGEANTLLARVAGTPAEARRLALAIRVLRSLQELENSRTHAADHKKLLDGYLARVRRDLADLDREIQQEAVLGRRSADRVQYRGELLEYLALLETVGRSRETFAYATGLDEARQRADRRFDRATGSPAKLVAEAWAQRWTTELKERGRSEAFKAEYEAYTNNPRLYMTGRWLDVWDQLLPHAMKYVLAVNRDSVEVWLDLEKRVDPMAGSITSDGTGQ